jgi:YVTN family beta-propeller protein
MTMRTSSKILVFGLILACGAPALPMAPPRTGDGPPRSGPDVDAGDAGATGASADPKRSAPTRLATGDLLTPDAAPGSVLLPLVPGDTPGARDAFAVSVALDGKGTLAVLTSGYNRGSTGRRPEHVYLYDVSAGAPAPTEILALPNAFWGLAFADATVWVSGGSDDAIAAFAPATDAPHAPHGAAVVTKLGHASGLGLGQSPYAAGLAVLGDGSIAVANHENDSLSLVRGGQVATEIDLRPPAGPGGDFPAGVLAIGDRVYVTTQRSGELLEVSSATRAVTRRLRVGAQPTKLVATRDGATLFVATAGSDAVAVVDRATFTVTETVPIVPQVPGLPRGATRGANPNAVALSPDERTLYVSLGGLNAIAVVDRTGGRAHVTGWVPTGFYPNDVAAFGDWIYVAYGKSTTGPNPGGPRASKPPSFGPAGADAFSLSLLQGGLHAFPRPTQPEIMAALSRQVLVNARLDAPPTVPPIFEALRGKVKHVVFVIGENRTYDQVLGDREGADGDPTLVHWGAALTPNQHALAATFVTFDRFFASGGVSGDGWQWTVAGRTTDPTEKEVPLMYANRGRHTYDWEGANRGINVGLPTVAARKAWNPKTPADPRLLPGVSDVAAPHQDAPFLWDVVHAAGLTVRNYGCFAEDVRYGLEEKDPGFVPLLRAPAKTKTRVAFPTAPGLLDDTDPYYRGFDMSFPDAWRIEEWLRELDEQEKKGTFPALSLVRLPHDHFGSFKSAAAGLDTPDTQMADHDWALGRIVERLAKSPFWDDTVVVVVEDDAQDGADHVDSHRSLLFMAGGHVARGVVSHQSWSTPSVLRTIELLLGLAPLGRNDAVAPPIDDAFTADAAPAAFVAQVPDVLRTTKLDLPPAKGGKTAAKPRGDGSFWEARTAGMDFSREDRVPTAELNEALWCALVAPDGCGTRARLAARATDDDDDDD